MPNYDNFRWLNTRFWDDIYIQTLDPSEKLLFIYFLTNPLTNLCGIYEISIRRIAFDTGFINEIINTILKRFEKDKKIYYIKGWVIIINFIKNQKFSGIKLETAIKNQLLKVNPDILANIKQNKIPYPYPIDTLPIPQPINISKSISINKNINKRKDISCSSKMTINDFNTFWNGYPRKVGKPKAQDKFLKLNHDLLPKILESIENHKKSQQWQDIKYIPHPTTWLNREGWNDETIKPNFEQEIKKMLQEYGDQAVFRFEKKYGKEKLTEYQKHFFL